MSMYILYPQCAVSLDDKIPGIREAEFEKIDRYLTSKLEIHHNVLLASEVSVSNEKYHSYHQKVDLLDLLFSVLQDDVFGTLIPDKEEYIQKKLNLCKRGNVVPHFIDHLIRDIFVENTYRSVFEHNFSCLELVVKNFMTENQEIIFNHKTLPHPLLAIVKTKHLQNIEEADISLTKNKWINLLTVLMKNKAIQEEVKVFKQEGYSLGDICAYNENEIFITALIKILPRGDYFKLFQFSDFDRYKIKNYNFRELISGAFEKNILEDLIIKPESADLLTPLGSAVVSAEKRKNKI